MPTALDRFAAKIAQRDDGCWEWIGALFNTGYGAFWNGDLRAPRRPVTVGAHRWSYEHFVGPIADGLHLDHLCRHPECVNPDHLEPVTCRVNLLRGATLAAANSVKTHCPQGHPYDEINTKVDARGIRNCRICCNARTQQSKQRRRLRENAA